MDYYLNPKRARKQTRIERLVSRIKFLEGIIESQTRVIMSWKGVLEKYANGNSWAVENERKVVLWIGEDDPQQLAQVALGVVKFKVVQEGGNRDAEEVRTDDREQAEGRGDIEGAGNLNTIGGGATGGGSVHS